MQGKFWEAFERRAAVEGRGQGAKREIQESKISQCWGDNRLPTRPECRDLGKRPETLILEGQALGKRFCPKTTAQTEVY